MLATLALTAEGLPADAGRNDAGPCRADLRAAATIGIVSEAVPAKPGPEDVKIITLARSARARVAAAEGAAVRDETGRTYAAAAVALPSLQLSALHLAVAMAASSGASALEAAALVNDGGEPDARDVAAVRELGPGAVVFHAAPDGTVLAILLP
jgi:hypothetical protein